MSVVFKELVVVGLLLVITATLVRESELLAQIRAASEAAEGYRFKTQR